MRKEQFKHFYRDKVRWGDCDQLGHVNNAVYLRFIESGRLEYFLEILGIELRTDSASGWVMADLQCNFKQQVHYPNKLEIGTRFSRVGNSSALVEAAIFIEGNDEPVFTSKVTSVWCDYTKGTSAKIPDTIRHAIKQHEGEVEGLN